MKLAPDGSFLVTLSTRTSNTGNTAPDGSSYAVTTDGNGNTSR